MMNLLVDRLLSTGVGNLHTLPGLLAASARGEVKGFPRLRAHQRTAWHMFRVQLAALALRHGELREPPEDEDAWATLLRALSAREGADGEMPWCLVVRDHAHPAFLQPPDPGGLKWQRVPTPDALDMLITARNHDLKAAIAQDAAPEDWVYALVSLQTSEGFGGSRNYGIARMNGGSSSRPFLGFAPANGTIPDLCAWWRRDVSLLMDMLDAGTTLEPGGRALLWCHPWPEGESLPARALDPFMIEVCRRIRLGATDQGITAKRATSKAARIDARAFRGALGDAWAPVTRDKDGLKALTLSEGNFDYRRLVDLLLSGNWTTPAATIRTGEERAGEMVLVAEALSRGNSKTDGLKSRIVPVPETARGPFQSTPVQLAGAASAQIEEIGRAAGALVDSVSLYASGGDYEKQKKNNNERGSGARSRLDTAADAVFFEHLWARLAGKVAKTAEEQAVPVRAFHTFLCRTARAELERAFTTVPCTSIHASRAQVRSRRRLEAMLHKSGLVRNKVRTANV